MPTKMGMSFSRDQHHLNFTTKVNKERLWYHRYRHLSEQNLHKLARKGLMEVFDYNVTNLRRKHHRGPFEPSKRQINEPLELVHTDVCGKISEKSIGNAQYFMKNKLFMGLFLEDKGSSF